MRPGSSFVVAGSNPGGSGRELPPVRELRKPNRHGSGVRADNARRGETGPLDKKRAKTKAPAYVAGSTSASTTSPTGRTRRRASPAPAASSNPRGVCTATRGPRGCGGGSPRRRLAVSRALAIRSSPGGRRAAPEIKTERVTPRDAFVVLASDGVWDHVSSAEAVRIVGECVNEGALVGAP